jgi:hypothetical protein
MVSNTNLGANSNQRAVDLATGQTTQGTAGKTGSRHKALAMIPAAVSSSLTDDESSPSLRSKITQSSSSLNREYSSGAVQPSTVLPPSPRPGDSKANRVAGRFTNFLKASKAGDDSSDQEYSPVISRATPAVTLATSSGSIFRNSDVEYADREDTLQTGTVNPKEIRCFFAIDPILMKREILDVVLREIHGLGRILSEIWQDRSRSMNAFDMKKKLFEDSILPLFVEVIQHRRPADRIEYPRGDSKDTFEIRRMFSKQPVDMKKHRDTLDVALYELICIGGEFIRVWENPGKGMKGYEMKKRSFETSIRPRFESAICKMEELAKIQMPKDQIESIFLGLVEKFLQENVFLDFNQFINSPINRRKLQQLVSDAEEIFNEMEALDSPGGVKLGGILRRFGFEGPEETSNAGEDKSGDDFAFLLCAYQLCDKHRLAVETICRELLKPQLLQGVSSNSEIVNEIMKHANQQLRPRWAAVNYDRTVLMKEWVQKVRDRITYRYLDVFKGGMMEMIRKLLVDNIAARPFKIENFKTRKNEEATYWACTSLNQLSEDFAKRLVVRTMSAPIDVARAMTLQHHVRCYLNGAEVEAETDTPVGRFKAYLKTCSVLFGHPKLLWDLAQLMGFPSKDKQDMQTDYPHAYSKLMNLDGTQKRDIKAKFVRLGYDQGIFDRALKFFKVYQNILDQKTLYFYTFMLLSARQQKFNLNNLGTKKLEEDSNIVKNEFVLRVDGTRCQISVIRHDGFIYQEVVLRQEFTIVIDVENDLIMPPGKDDISMSIICPSNFAEKPEIKTLLFNFPLVLDSLGFAPLKINITKPTV